MQGVKYIGPIFDGCYDDQTEVLTLEGWKFFSDLSFGDFLATLHLAGVLEYYKPDQLIVKDWNGKMCHFYNHRAGIDLLVTPDHNMYVAPEIFRRPNKKSSGFRFEKAEEVIDKYRLFKKDCINPAPGIPFIEVCERQVKTEDWLEFLGYYLSEGSSTITDSPSKHYLIQIRQFGEHLSKMAEALQKVTSSRVNVRPKDGKAITNDKKLAIYLKNTFGNKYQKFIPREILNKCSVRQLRVLFQALMLGDGHAPESGGSSYTTASLRLRDDFMELLLKIGVSGSYVRTKEKGEEIKIYDRVHTCQADNWTISVRWSQHLCAIDGSGWGNGDATKNRIEDYRGKVYCASVPNHTLFVRRNGKAVWCGNSGYAEAARNYVLSIHKKGYPITVQPISFEQTHPDLGKNAEILRGLVNNRILYDKVIIHCTPDLWRNFVPHESNKHIIGFTVWETSNLHPLWTQSCAQAREVWLPCDWNLQVFRDSGVTVPLYKIPHATEIPNLSVLPNFNLEGISENTFVFYSIFQWQERKNPYGLLNAYLAAFNKNEDVVLVLKTYTKEANDNKDELRKQIVNFRSFLNLDNYPRMYLLVENLSKEAMLALHKRGDCFVLLQRAEGWGLPHFEAASCGKPIITPSYGGQTEFLKEDNSYLLDYHLTPVGGMPWSPYYKGDQWWCEPNAKQAVETLRYVYHNRQEANEKGARAREYVAKNFTSDIVGDLIIQRFREIDGGKVNV